MFDTKDLDNLASDLAYVSKALKAEKETKKFLRDQGKELNKENKKQANLLMINKKTGNFKKGFKKGKVYKYQGNLTIRAYNSSPHAHLLEFGHRKVTQSGDEIGFTEGYHFMEKARNIYGSKYEEAVEEFIDDLLQDNDL